MGGAGCPQTSYLQKQAVSPIVCQPPYISIQIFLHGHTLIKCKYIDRFSLVLSFCCFVLRKGHHIIRGSLHLAFSLLTPGSGPMSISIDFPMLCVFISHLKYHWAKVAYTLRKRKIKPTGVLSPDLSLLCKSSGRSFWQQPSGAVTAIHQ